MKAGPAGQGQEPDGRAGRWKTALRFVLTAFMILAAIAWILYLPYDPDAVWSPIPAHAMYFSRHERPSERLTALTHNPLTVTVIRSVGIEPEVLQDFISDPDAQRWVRRLFGRDLVLAYVPELGPRGEPAWVFASWIGNRSQRLRWTLALRGLPGVESVSLPGQTTFWRLDQDLAGPDTAVSLALSDGLLLGAISVDPTAVTALMSTQDRRPGYPALLNSAWLAEADNLTATLAPDRGAYALRTAAGPDDIPTSLFPVLRSMDASCVSGAVIGSFRISAANRAQTNLPSLDGLQAVLGDTPVFWTLMSPALLTSLTRQTFTPRWAVALAQTLRPRSLTEYYPSEPGVANSDADSAVGYPLFFAVLNERYTGSISAGEGLAAAWIRGLKIPAVVAGVYVGDEVQADAVFMNILDGLNREYRLGLIPRRDSGANVTVIEDSRSGASFYERLMLRERVGAVYYGGWLLFAGQAVVLERLLENKSRDYSRPAEIHRWQPPSLDEVSLAYCWADLTSFGALANDALAAVSLMLLIRDPAGSLPVRLRLAETQAWVEGLRTFEHGVLWLDGRDARFNLQFALGPAEINRN